MGSSLYGQSLALLTDLYQLTMAYGYWKLERHHQEAVFHLTFRKQPFNGGYSIACGLGPVIEFLERLRFDPSDLSYLATLTGNDGAPLFDPKFLSYLGTLEFSCDLDAMPEGTVVFPHEPILRVRGPMMICQLLETPLLNIVNFQTLIATKAARVVGAAAGDPVIEFGLRRAQGIDGSLSASRAAFVGGCAATSNVLAGKLFGIPVKGTHAHSWVMSFDTELESFEAYAAAMPNNCVFLVDTYDTLQGVRHAAMVGRQLKAAGHKMIGIRLDSGDLAYLSIEARKILDEAGLTDAVILASNDLDEQIITSLKQQGATIAMWGVGTKLVTAYDQPALGGVYKLGAIRDDAGQWKYKLKLSEQSVKISTPGVQQVRRFFQDGLIAGDAIYDLQLGIGDEPTIVDPGDPIHQRTFTADQRHQDLLIPIFRGGKKVYDSPSLEKMQEHTRQQLATLHPTIKRIVNPHLYPVGLEQRLHDLKNRLIQSAKHLPG
jgi:nicotinate phosphoribosyltransferase